MRILTIAGLLMLLGAGLASAQETEITGFVDGAWLYDTANRNGEFGIDQVEVDITHQASEKTMLRTDLEWIKDGEEYLAQVEQAFMSYTTSNDIVWSMGKFNAPIGFELLDAPDMYQYSHALVFDYGLPTNLTGISASKTLGNGLDAVVHASNGWDRQTVDANLTFGGRLGYAAEAFAGGFSVISGREEAQPETVGDPVTPFTRTVYDVDLSYHKGPWTFGGEWNLGKVQLPADVEADWMAGLVMGHAELNDWLGFTARYDWFDDRDAYAFGLVDGQDQVRQAITLAPTFTLDDGFGAIVELRVDFSDQDAFVDSDGQATGTSTSVAFETTYSW